MDVTMVGCETLVQTDGIAGINNELMGITSVGDEAGGNKGMVLTTGRVGSTLCEALWRCRAITDLAPEVDRCLDKR